MVHRENCALHVAHIVLLGADRTKKPSHVAGVEAGGRNLVEQRLEGVVCVAVDQCHIDIGALELADRRNSTEPSSDDDDVRTR